VSAGGDRRLLVVPSPCPAPVECTWIGTPFQN
jgi:hypothetical protein